MANPAAEARAKVKSNHPEAVVVERGRNSIKHRLADAPNGRKRYALDVAIGPFHYGPGNDQEIDTELVPSTAPWDWEMTKAGFEVRALSDLSAGQVIEYRSGSEWVRFQPMALQYSNDLNQIQQIAIPQSVNASVVDDTLTWTDGYGPGRTLTWQAQTARLMKLLTIDSLADLPAIDQFILDGGNPVLELNLIFAHSSGVTPFVNGQEWKRGDRDTQGLVEFRDGQGNILWWFNLPRSWDSEGNEQLGTFRFKKQGNSLFVSHRVPLSYVQGAVYPLMVDASIDEQISAADNEAYEDDDDTDFTANSENWVNSTATQANRKNSGIRFPNIVIAQGATIDNGTLLSLLTRFSGVFDDMNGFIHANDVDNAADFSSEADVNSRTRTTENVDWSEDNLSSSVYNDSPEIKTVVQAIISRGSWSSGNALMLLTVADTDADKACRTEGYGTTTSEAPKLHVEFTVSGAARRIFITQG